MYSIKYDALTVLFEMEPDCDKNHAIIQSIKNEDGEDVEVDTETQKDIKFLAEQLFSDIQYKHYLKTGKII